MELLLIRAGESYIRVRENSYQYCGIDKASVFPLDRVEEVKAHVHKLAALEKRAVCIKKLVMKEEDFSI